MSGVKASVPKLCVSTCTQVCVQIFMGLAKRPSQLGPALPSFYLYLLLHRSAAALGQLVIKERKLRWNPNWELLSVTRSTKDWFKTCKISNLINLFKSQWSIWLLCFDPSEMLWNCLYVSGSLVAYVMRSWFYPRFWSAQRIQYWPAEI